MKQKYLRIIIRCFGLVASLLLFSEAYSDEALYKYCYGKTKSQEEMAFSYFFSAGGLKSVVDFPIPNSSKDTKAELISMLKAREYNNPVELKVELYESCISSNNARLMSSDLEYCFFQDSVLSDVFDLKSNGRTIDQNLEFQLNNTPEEMHDHIIFVTQEIYETSESEQAIFLYDLFIGCNGG